MNFKSLSRLNAWPAMIASAVLMLWPAFASANCCCKSLLPSEPDTAKSCCSQSVDSASSSCCEANASSVVRSDQASGSQCCGSSVGLRCCGSDDCQCGLRCCQTFDAIVASPSPSHDIDTSSLVVFSVAPASEFQTRGFSFHGGFSFLRAQDHCALISRWLK